MRYIFFSLLFILSSNCNTLKKSSNNLTETQVIEGIYLVKKLNQKDISKYELTMKFDPILKRINGFSGCNTYSCKYNFTKNSINFDRVLTSKIYCNDTQAIENDFLRILEQSSLLIKRTENQIEMKNNENHYSIILTKTD